MLNFLWINAINRSSEVETRYPNLGIGYLIASLTSAFGENTFRFNIIDSNVDNVLKTFRPDIVGISCVSQNYHRAVEYARQANARNIPVIIGGVHITALPQSLSRDMTVGCIGESEETLIELMQLYLDQESFPPHQLALIRGIVFYDEQGLLRQTAPRPLQEDLDSLPYPDRRFLHTSSHTYMFTSRGCPYKCSFCASSRFWQKVRFFSAQRVVDEIELLIQQYDIRFISFFDDLFVANRQRFFDIVELLVEKGIAGKIKFSCSIRANVVTEDICRALKRMGVVSVGMGLESGNQRVLSWLKKGGITVEDNRNAVALLNAYGIRPNASFVIGSPDETEEEIMDTLRFIKSVDLALFDVYVLTPFPGTPVWDIAKEKGLVSEGAAMQWEHLNVNFEVQPQKAIILSSTLSRKDLIALYRKFRRYRLFHNIMKIWTHPMLSDLPRFVVRTLQEKLFGIFK